MTVHGDSMSGNCYKVQLVLNMLGVEHRWQEMSILAGDTQTSAFLVKNASGKIPLIELDDGHVLSESNAIMGYLAAGSSLIPSDNFINAKMYQWMFFEQYSHEPYIAVARFIQLYLGLPEERLVEYQSLHVKGHKALSVMDAELAAQPFLCGDQFTLADIALFAYTHVAHQGGFELGHYPNIRQWLARITLQAGFIAMRSKA
ncbi:glutathione S-transferase family protein [Shewanella livingstonensis]|uniref:Glutathione S-transferase family protein n=1 Tax=Shewanella livingstonensis TaxID=150120 RepID=A0A3G8LZX5_9GAMM|nr:glutathione S-transferase family protein [Shewanella livingstonensis]AZG75196.1 glutathione S-transferase family protein [Shewanella livingstonensis]